MNLSRRAAVRHGLAVGAAALTAPHLLADDPARTPRLTEGPFYPDKLPLDTDNDLLVVNDDRTPAAGEVAHLTGRVLDADGRPVTNATVEIWQCDAHGVYLHTSDSEPNRPRQDRHFQGFGRFTTGPGGGYYFRTIKPVPYSGRPAPHIHVKVKRAGREVLTTQILVAGHPGNATDGVFRGVRDPAARQRLLATFAKADGRPDEWAAAFDLVLGRTPDDRQNGRVPPAGR